MVVFNQGLNNQFIINLDQFIIFHINTENVNFSLKIGKIYCYGEINEFEDINNDLSIDIYKSSIQISPELKIISSIPYEFYTQNCSYIEIYNYRIYYKIFDEIKGIKGSADETAKIIDKSINSPEIDNKSAIFNGFLKLIMTGQFIL